jgi:phosphatidylglycerol:prolipoprotein diacylglycerol transferase
MYPILFTVGQWSISTYTILLYLGIILGLLITYFEGKRLLGSGEQGLDLGLWTVIGGILGGRIGFVLAHWRIFQEDWLQALQIWKGGLAFHGAFLGGLVVMLIFALASRRREDPVSFWQLGDVLVPGLALGIAFGWAACLMGGCSYGNLGQGFGYAVLPDLYGVEASRFATQVVGLGYALLLFAGFWLLRRHWPFSGASFLMYVLLYFGGLFFLEFTRGDEALYLGPWRLAQWLDLVLALAAAVGLIVLWFRAGQSAEELEEIGSEGAEELEEAEEMRSEGAEEMASEGVEEQGSESTEEIREEGVEAIGSGETEEESDG